MFIVQAVKIDRRPVISLHFSVQFAFGGGDAIKFDGQLVSARFDQGGHLFFQREIAIRMKLIFIRMQTDTDSLDFPRSESRGDGWADILPFLAAGAAYHPTNDFAFERHVLRFVMQMSKFSAGISGNERNQDGMQIWYPAIGKVVEIFDENSLDDFRIGDPQTGVGAIKVAENLAVFSHQIAVVLR